MQTKSLTSLGTRLLGVFQYQDFGSQSAMLLCPCDVHFTVWPILKKSILVCFRIVLAWQARKLHISFTQAWARVSMRVAPLRVLEGNILKGLVLAKKSRPLIPEDSSG